MSNRHRDDCLAVLVPGKDCNCAEHEGPVHEHDCDRCTYIGPVVLAGNRYDVYACPQVHEIPTVIMRWGAMGDYDSGHRLLELLPLDMQDRAVEAVPTLARYR
jgi:hypothetical protein